MQSSSATRPSRSLQLKTGRHGSQSDRGPIPQGALSLGLARSRWSCRASKPPTKLISTVDSSADDDLLHWYVGLHLQPPTQQFAMPQLRRPMDRITAWKRATIQRRQQRQHLALAEMVRTCKAHDNLVGALNSGPVEAPLLGMANNFDSSDAINSHTTADTDSALATPRTTAARMEAHDSPPSGSSSGLSSAPPSVGSTPASLRISHEPQLRGGSGTTRTSSPVRRSKRDRKVVPRFNQYSNEDHGHHDAKRRKLLPPSTAPSSWSSSAAPVATASPRRRRSNVSPTIAAAAIHVNGLSASSSDQNDQPQIQGRKTRKPAARFEESVSRSEALPIVRANNGRSKYARVKENKAIELDLVKGFLDKARDASVRPTYNVEEAEQYLNKAASSRVSTEGLNHESWKEDNLYPGFDRQNPSYFQADGITRMASSNAAQNGSNRNSEAPSPPAKPGKSNRALKSQGKGGKGNKGRSGGAPGGRDRDSPEPPNKSVLAADDKLLLQHYRARQAELKKFFAAIAIQQREALEMIASRDLKRLHKKQKAHTKVTEHEIVIEQLQQKEAEIKALIEREYKMRIDLAQRTVEAQKEVIEAQFLQRCEQSQKEHLRGAQGDLTIFHKVHRAARDETKTDNGSDLECYFPRYHEMPEPDRQPRGYNSSRLRDEKPFRESLASYDEQAQRDVIEDDIVGPVQQSVAEQNALRKADEERKTRLDCLVAIAEDELKEKRGYLIPRPLRSSENPQFALSRLADCAEYVSRAHPNEAYIFMRVAPRDMASFPRQHLERVPPPNPQDSTPPTPKNQSQSSTPRQPTSRRHKSNPSIGKLPAKEEEPQSQSSSNGSTPLLTIAPAPPRMPPPMMSSQHHHHRLPSLSMAPPPAATIPPMLGASLRPRVPSLAPLITSNLQSSPPHTPTFGRPPTMPSQGPHPFQPGHTRHLSHPGPPRPLPHLQHQYPPQPPQAPPQFSPTQPHASRFERPPPPPSPSEPSPSIEGSHRRISTTSSNGTSRPPTRGLRREKGQITFTNVQTPESERFRSPTQPPSIQPGQAVLRPGTQPNTPNGLGTGKIANTFVNAAPDANSRASQAAEAAAMNAMINQGQGAGPKGGKRVLLPKGQR